MEENREGELEHEFKSEYELSRQRDDKRTQEAGAAAEVKEKRREEKRGDE